MSASYAFGGQKQPSNIPIPESVVYKLSGYDSYATAGNVTFTAADCLKGLILRDTAGAARADALPSVAALVAAGVQVGEVVEFVVANISAGNFASTVALGTGMTFGATRALAQNTCQTYVVVVTGATAATVLTPPATTFNV